MVIPLIISFQNNLHAFSFLTSFNINKETLRFRRGVFCIAHAIFLGRTASQDYEVPQGGLSPALLYG